MIDKSKRKPNKWDRLRADNAKLQKENAELKVSLQLVRSHKDLDAIVDGARRPDPGSRALALGEALEPPTEMPIDPREPLVAEPAEVEPDGDRGWSLES